MTIPAESRPAPLPALQTGFSYADPKSGMLSPVAQQTHEKLRAYVSGAGRIIPVSATGTNVITLILNDASPNIQAYMFGDCFLFWAENTSSGSVTARLTLPDGSFLDTLKVFIDAGATQAGSGDIVANSLYVAFFVPILDSNAGGFVAK